MDVYQLSTYGKVGQNFFFNKKNQWDRSVQLEALWTYCLYLTNKKLIYKLSDIPSNPEIVDYYFLNNIHEKLKSESSKNSRKPGLLAKNRQSSRLNSCFIKYCFFLLCTYWDDISSVTDKHSQVSRERQIVLFYQKELEKRA